MTHRTQAGHIPVLKTFPVRVQLWRLLECVLFNDGVATPYLAAHSATETTHKRAWDTFWEKCVQTLDLFQVMPNMYNTCILCKFRQNLMLHVTIFMIFKSTKCFSSLRNARPNLSWSKALTNPPLTQRKRRQKKAPKPAKTFGANAQWDSQDGAAWKKTCTWNRQRRQQNSSWWRGKRSRDKREMCRWGSSEETEVGRENARIHVENRALVHLDSGATAPNSAFGCWEMRHFCNAYQKGILPVCLDCDQYVSGACFLLQQVLTGVPAARSRAGGLAAHRPRRRLPRRTEPGQTAPRRLRAHSRQERRLRWEQNSERHKKNKQQKIYLHSRLCNRSDTRKEGGGAPDNELPVTLEDIRHSSQIVSDPSLAFAELLVWTGLKKGPPRRLKFPDVEEVAASIKKEL